MNADALKLRLAALCDAMADEGAIDGYEQEQLYRRIDEMDAGQIQDAARAFVGYVVQQVSG